MGLVAPNNVTSPPTLQITNVQVASATTSTCQIVWTTNVPATSEVDYGTTASYGFSTPTDPTMVTNHTVNISGLAAGTTYEFQVSSTDAQNNSGKHLGQFKTPGFSISGTIAPAADGSGATLTLSGAANGATNADSSGSYIFTGLANGKYTVTPARTGYSFSPASQNPTLNGVNLSGVNFTGSTSATAPAITTQPANQTVTAGQTATFTVVASGTAPLSYQWQKNGGVISGAISSSYTTPATTSSDNGAQFAVMVTNSAGSVTSNLALLTVNSLASQLSATPNSANFGNVITGTSVSQTISLTNNGSATITISQATVSGTGFSITGLTIPTTIAANASTTFNAMFTPNSAGAVTGALSVVSNASNSPLTIPLSGTGVAATFLLGANPTSLSFGNVNVGSNGSSSVILTNAGNSNVTISSVTTSGAGFSASGVTSGTVLTPNQSATLNVAFAPTITGSVTGSVTVASSATNSPLTIPLTGNGVQGTLTANPSSFNFGNVLVGSSISQTITLNNSGTASVTISAASASGTGFSLTGLSVPLTLAAGQATSFSAQFAPTATGSASGSVSITSNAPGSPLAIALSGSGVQPQLAASPASVSFGNVITGIGSSQTITLTNSGTASLTISQATVSGAGFTLSGLPVPTTIAAGGSTTFSAAFAPTTAGSVSGSISLVSNAPNSPLAIALSGTGVAATFLLGANPTSLSFGNVNVGSNGSSSVILTNTGNSNVTISSVTTSGAGFSASGVTSGTVLIPNQSVTVNVAFAPTVVGSVTGTVSVASNATNSPATITLSGTGVQGTLTPTPSSFNFGNVLVGSSISQTITLNNSGTASVTISAASASGTGFSLTGLSVPLTLAAGQNASFSAQFAPSATGSASGSISITSNAPGSPLTIALSGSGVQPQLTATPSSASFGNVITGTNASQTIKLANTGSASLTISQATVSGTGFSLSSLPIPTTLAAGNSTTFNVAFAPSSAGSVSGSVSLISNAPNSPLTIPLSGTGVASTYLLGANPSTLSFGNVNLGSTSSLPVTLTNTGNSLVTISSVTTSGTGFSANGVSAGTTLTPNQSLSLNVAFAPATAGTVSGSVSVASNATNSPASISLSATGVATPPTVAISSPANGATVSGTIAVSGTASDSLGISSVAVQVDGGAFSAAAGTTSWTFSLDTTPLSNAAHTLTARATDTVGTTASTSVSVNVSNSSGTIINVKNFGATGNGSTDDTNAINNAINALTPGATLLFPCGTYIVTSQITVNLSNITVDGSSCATVKNTSGGTFGFVIGPTSASPNFGSTVALSATANELATSFTTVSSLGVAAGDYVLLQQGGKDSAGGSNDTGCDTVGCRGELLKVASVSGNTITVTTALHDTYSPSVNAATAQKLLSPLTGITVKNITFDGSGGTNYGVVYGFALVGAVDSTVTGVTSKNVQGIAVYGRSGFNLSFTNITVTGAGSEDCGSAVWMEKQGNLSINGMSISSLNPGAPYTGCIGDGAFGFELVGSANGTITNLTVDATTGSGRPFKTDAARWFTFNSTTVKNLSTVFNGISIEYWSSHNTFNNCVVTNNGGTGVGTGSAGINSFGNFNQYNTYNNCTVTGNGDLQFIASSYDALRLGQDSFTTINGGTYTGSNTSEPVIWLEGANPTVTNATISGPGIYGIQIDYNGTNACINNNTFVAGTSQGGAISAAFSSDIGSGNILNGLSSNLTPGTCGTPTVSVSISPTAATVASGGTQQFTATVTGNSNTAVTWTASAGSISSSGLFTAPTVSASTNVTITATSQADTTKSASASVTVTPPNTFGYAVQGALVGTTMSNEITAGRFQMTGQNGTIVSMSVFIASPISASPNNQFQVAIYADNNGTPGTLIASSASQAIVPDAWNTVPISASVTANTYYWLAYNTNGLAANTNGVRYDSGAGTYSYTQPPISFGTWPSNFTPLGGIVTGNLSIYATYH